MTAPQHCRNSGIRAGWRGPALSPFLVGLVLISTVWPGLAVSASVNIENVRVRPSPERTRMVFELSAPVEHRVFMLENPRRLVVDISAAKLQQDLGKLDVRRTPISQIRAATRNGNDVRVVLDLSATVKPRSFVLKPIMQYPDRLVVDLYTQDQQTQPTVQRQDRIVQQMRDVVIVVDAGHGGDDPGAIGPGNLYEKDVVLAISRKLAERFNKEAGFRGKLTRTGDYYLAHRKRTDMARKVEADVFLSIHADAFKVASASGASVYVISQRGATSETARWLAEKENQADLIGGVGLYDKEDMLAGVLLDLYMSKSLEASLDMGSSVLSAIKPVNRLHKQQVEQAAFLVLKSPDMPSLLIETGFISNPAEARKLGTRSHQERMAAAIFVGVKNYIQNKPPQGTFLAWKKRGGDGRLATYKIVSGDTLSAIAQRHQTSARKLKQVNGLMSDRIRIGQVLKIPTS